MFVPHSQPIRTQYQTGRPRRYKVLHAELRTRAPITTEPTTAPAANAHRNTENARTPRRTLASGPSGGTMQGDQGLPVAFSRPKFEGAFQRTGEITSQSSGRWRTHSKYTNMTGSTYCGLRWTAMPDNSTTFWRKKESTGSMRKMNSTENMTSLASRSKFRPDWKPSA